MKKDASTILGFLIVLCAIAITFMDMHYSTLERYTFELKGWQVFAGLGIGLALIFIPQNKMSELLQWTWKAIVKKKTGDGS